MDKCFRLLLQRIYAVTAHDKDDLPLAFTL